MNTFRYALLSISLLTLNAVAMEEEVLGTDVTLEEVATELKPVVVAGQEAAAKAGEAVKSAAKSAIEKGKELVGSGVEAVKNNNNPEVKTPEAQVVADATLAEKAKAVFANGYNRSAQFVSDAATKADGVLESGVDFVTTHVGGVELATAHPVAAKVTLVAGTTAAVTAITYGTYKLYRYCFPVAEQA
jgi:hypothetical protein